MSSLSVQSFNHLYSGKLFFTKDGIDRYLIPPNARILCCGLVEDSMEYGYGQFKLQFLGDQKFFVIIYPWGTYEAWATQHAERTVLESFQEVKKPV